MILQEATGGPQTLHPAVAEIRDKFCERESRGALQWGKGEFSLNPITTGIFHILSLIHTATPEGSPLLALRFYRCRRRDLKSLGNVSKITAGQRRAWIGRTLYWKLCSFPSSRPSLPEGSPSASVKTFHSLSTNVYSLLHPASLYKQALGGLSLPGQGQALPCRGALPWLVISWFRTSETISESKHCSLFTLVTGL